MAHDIREEAKEIFGKINKEDTETFYSVEDEGSLIRSYVQAPEVFTIKKGAEIDRGVSQAIELLNEEGVRAVARPKNGTAGVRIDRYYTENIESTYRKLSQICSEIFNTSKGFPKTSKKDLEPKTKQIFLNNPKKITAFSHLYSLMKDVKDNVEYNMKTGRPKKPLRSYLSKIEKASNELAKLESPGGLIEKITEPVIFLKILDLYKEYTGSTGDRTPNPEVRKLIQKLAK